MRLDAGPRGAPRGARDPVSVSALPALFGEEVRDSAAFVHEVTAPELRWKRLDVARFIDDAFPLFQAVRPVLDRDAVEAVRATRVGADEVQRAAGCARDGAVVPQ